MDIYSEVISNTAMSSNFINTLYMFFLNPKPSSVAVQPGFCLTWLEPLKTGYVMTGFIDRVYLVLCVL